MFKGFPSAFLVLSGLIIWSGCKSPEVPAEIAYDLPAEVSEKMSAQEHAWSSGDPAGFMAGAYWPSDSLVFVGSQGLTYGYAQVLDNYKRSYPDPAAMGKLSFNNLSWKPLGATFGLLIGQWHLERDSVLGPLSGHYSLIWERQPDRGWVIIADHSS